MNKSEIRERLSAILVEKFGMQEASLDFTEPQITTGLNIGLGGLQLYEFLMCVENEFCIYFKPQDFESVSFRNLHDIETAVYMKLSSTNVQSTQTHTI